MNTFDPYCTGGKTIAWTYRSELHSFGSMHRNAVVKALTWRESPVHYVMRPPDKRAKTAAFVIRYWLDRVY